VIGGRRRGAGRLLGLRRPGTRAVAWAATAVASLEAMSPVGVGDALDAEELLGSARRPLVLGIGGGGDVVGALATAEHARLYQRADPVLGGISWERRPIDPRPGPRRAREIGEAQPLAEGILLAGPRTSAGPVRFAESRMAEFLDAPTVLVDPHPGPARIACSLRAAATKLGCDLLVFIDCGGDVLAVGDERGLASPLCDAVMLAAAGRLQDEGHAVLAGVFGPGCDGELTQAELSERFAVLGRAGALAGARGLTARVAARLHAATQTVLTEASALPLRAFAGEAGEVVIREGGRVVTLSPAAALTVYFDAARALSCAAPLARAVRDAADLDEANAILRRRGVPTELDAQSGSPAAA